MSHLVFAAKRSPNLRQLKAAGMVVLARGMHGSLKTAREMTRGVKTLWFCVQVRGSARSSTRHHEVAYVRSHLCWRVRDCTIATVSAGTPRYIGISTPWRHDYYRQVQENACWLPVEAPSPRWNVGF